MNGSFQLVNMEEGFGIKIQPPTDQGQPLNVIVVADYLNANNIPYKPDELKMCVSSKEEKVLKLGTGECPRVNETYRLKIREDMMEATAFFLPPSETGSSMSIDEFLKDMKFRKITFGLKYAEIKNRFEHPTYCEEFVVAQGKSPRQGTDAKICYHFPTDLSSKPVVKEDGSVDFYNLKNITPCKKGEILAHIVPEYPGEEGYSILGLTLKPRTVKRVTFKYGRNLEVSEDRLSLISQVDGHVTLVEDKVFVSNVFEVENVDVGTGNIEFDGSVQINGNVLSGFSVKAGGNVIISGVVEGAYIEAAGDIVIHLGMNGMGKGELKAGGNIISKFIENATVSAKGYVTTESILHSNVSSGNEVAVEGKRGFISGGHVCAGKKIRVRNLGGTMGATTVVEVGVDPEIKKQFLMVQKEMLESQNVIKNAQPVLNGFREKRERGARFNQEQMDYIKNLVSVCEEKKKELLLKKDLYISLQEKLNEQRNAEIEVSGEAYPGTVISIQDISMTLQKVYSYCRFVRSNGEIILTSL